MGKNNKGKAKPPIKWVGGKGKLIDQLSQYFPDNFNEYFEPFMGGGAVFFHLSPQGKAHLNDVNKDLINLYRTIKTDTDLLIKELKKLEEKYIRLNEDARKDFYYKIRMRYNQRINEPVIQSAYFVFLNKTGYNGLYRVNSSGGFNVPFGQYKKPSILDAENLYLIADLLKNKKFQNVDFVEAVNSAKKGDFVYFDPPYHPLNETSDFTSYTKDSFGVVDQERLAETFKDLDKRGCLVMLSNSATPFIKRLYSNFRQETVQANRAINCKAKGRGKIDELLILNY